MSPIQQNPSVAEKTSKSSKPEGRASAGVSSEKPGNSDQDMMFAWSIGVTKAARASAQHVPANEDACPPEVYIG